MTDDKRPLDHAMDLLFFAPVGLAATARDLVPSLAKRGRDEFDPQVGTAKMVGQMALSQGRSQAEKALERAFSQAQATLRHLGLLGEDGAGWESPKARTAPAGRRATDEDASSPSSRFEDAPAAGTLAIPDYESLSASQVVPRLSSLSVEELEAARAYEAAHRGRKTILNKIAQLSGH